MKLFLAPSYRNQTGLPSFGAERISLWKKSAEILGARYISFWARRQENDAVIESVGSTHPLRWMMKYITFGMAAHDPEIILGLGASDVLVFDYNTFDDPRFQSFVKMVHRTNIGTYSIVVPEQYKDGVSSITTFTFDALPISDKDAMASLIARAKIVAADLSSDFLAESIDISLEGAQLSSRELMILSHVADGKTYDQIAAELEISKWTVVAHVKNSKTKLRARNKSEAIAIATSLGLL